MAEPTAGRRTVRTGRRTPDRPTTHRSVPTPLAVGAARRAGSLPLRLQHRPILLDDSRSFFPVVHSCKTLGERIDHVRNVDRNEVPRRSFILRPLDCCVRRVMAAGAIDRGPMTRVERSGVLRCHPSPSSWGVQDHVARCVFRLGTGLNCPCFFAGDGGHPGEDGLVAVVAGCLSPDCGVGRNHGVVGHRRGAGETSDQCIDEGAGQFIEAGQPRFVVLSASVQQFIEDLVLRPPGCGSRRGVCRWVVRRAASVGEGHVRGFCLGCRRGEVAAAVVG